MDIRALWRPGVLHQFLTDPMPIWGGYTNPIKAWLPEAAHYVDGSRWSQSVVGDVSTTESVCVCGKLKCLAPSAFLKLVCSIPAYPLSFPCQRWWGLSMLFFVGMKCLCNVLLTCDYRRSDTWLDYTTHVKITHSESISLMLRNPWLAVPIWSRV